MKKEGLQFYFLISLIVIIFILSGFIFWPFMSACILALVVGIILKPLHNKILKLSGNRDKISALLTMMLFVILIMTPLFILGYQIFKEAQFLYISLNSANHSDSIFSIFDGLVRSLEAFFPNLVGFSIDFDQYFQGFLRILTQNLGTIFSGFAKLFSGLFIFFITLYYVLKDGKQLNGYVLKFSPLPDSDDEYILSKLNLAIHSVVKGNLLIAVIQGALAATGFYIFGIANPILWGTVTAVAALIPGIGTALILSPAILFLFFAGETINAVGLLIWGFVAVGLIDNFLGPRLVGSGTELHPLIVLISVLGGFMVFGPMGFLLGPLTLSLLFALVSIYFHVVNSRKLQ